LLEWNDRREEFFFCPGMAEPLYRRNIVPRADGKSQASCSDILPDVTRKARTNRPLTVSIVGAGNLGTALSVALPSAGYNVSLLATRNVRRRGRELQAIARRLRARVVEVGRTPLETDLIWITVPDDAIAATARVLATSQEWKGKFVFHSSGALTSDELAPLRRRGARVASVHPMMTFVRRSVPEFVGVAFAVEGQPAAVRAAKAMVQSLGGNAYVIRKQNKALYHAFGSFASPLVIALMASIETVGRAAGVRRQDVRRFAAPLLRRTWTNYLQHDAASAFSGPLARGDVATVRKHLSVLKDLPEIHAVYRALGRVALSTLPVKNRAAMERVLRTRP